MDVYLIEDDDLLEKYITIWIKAALILKTKLIESLSKTKDF